MRLLLIRAQTHLPDVIACVNNVLMVRDGKHGKMGDDERLFHLNLVVCMSSTISPVDFFVYFVIKLET